MQAMLSLLVAALLSSRASGFVVEEDGFVPALEEELEVLEEEEMAITSAIMAAGRHFSFLGEKGTIQAAGRNNRGQLGLGSTVDTSVFTEVVLSPPETYIVDATAGAFHSLFLTDAGEVFATGWNRFGQLALGDNLDRKFPTKITGLQNVVSLSAGYAHSLFLTGDGQVYSAGLNSMGQLGDGTMTNSNTHVAIPGMDNCSSIAAGYDFSLILDRGSEAWAVGNGLGGQLGDGMMSVSTEPVRAVTNVQDVAAGESHALFLMVPEVPQRQVVKAVGANFDGQLGDNTNIRKTTPVTIYDVDDINAMAAGGDSSCFSVGADLVLKCAGSNRDGQLGLGAVQTASAPQEVLGNFLKMSVGDAHSMFLNYSIPKGRVYSTGNNFYGELGDGSTVSSREVIEVATVDVSPTLPPTPEPTQGPGTPQPTPAPATPQPTPAPAPGSPTPAPATPQPTPAPMPPATPAPTPAPTPDAARDPNDGGLPPWLLPVVGGGVGSILYLLACCFCPLPGSRRVGAPVTADATVAETQATIELA